MQKVKTATKQKNFSLGPQKKFSLGPPFSVFKHRKLCLNTETRHALSPSIFTLFIQDLSRNHPPYYSAC